MKNNDSSPPHAAGHFAKPNHRKSAGAFVAITALVLSGCISFLGPGPSRVATTDQAGSVRVAATTVSLWADVSTSMKPNFALTGDQAAAQVLPATETIDQEILTALGAGIAVGFPQTTASSSAGTTNSQQSSSSTTGGVTTTTATTNDGSTLTTTKQTQSGTAPALPSGTPAGGALPSAPGSPPTLGIDPVLKYKAANHLFQEVQLLNQEIANAADRKCFVPYVIGLKVAFMNYRPHLAYSLHEHIGFFFKSRISNDQVNDVGDALFVPGPKPPLPSGELAVACRQSDVVPEVIPLLVTDDIQVAVKARAAEAAQQIASALSFMTHGIGVGANLNVVKQSLESIQNHDLTSSLTVGRDTGSSIYVEVTANNTATGDPSLVNQTYDIPVLLLVPRSYFGGIHDMAPVQIVAATYQQLRDAGSGKILAARPNTTFVQQGSDIVESYLQFPADREAWRKLNDNQKEALIRRLYSPAASGTMLTLVGALQSFISIDGVACGGVGNSGQGAVPCIDPGQAPSIWTALGTLGDDANRSSFVVQLPLPAPITVPPQQVLLSDDGESPIKAVLGGVGGRSITELAAQLRLTPFDLKSGPGKEVDVSAQSLALDPVAHTLTLSFPSLKKLGIGCLAPTESEPITKAPQPDKEAKPGEAPKCPSRANGPGSTVRPNRIVLSLVGCNPQSQLCPDLTPTDLAPDPALADILSNLKQAESLFDTAQGDVSKSGNISRAMEQALSQLEAARSNARNAKSLNQLPALQASLYQAIGDLEQAQKAHKSLVDQQVSATNELRRLSLPPARASAIGVTLVAASSSANPAKVKVAGGGSNICIQDGGVGTIYLMVNGTPTGDSGALTVDGASVASTVDSNTNSAMPFGKTGYTFSKDGKFTIGLTNVAANTTVNIAVQAYSGTTADGGAVKLAYSAATNCSPIKLTQH